MKSAKNIQVAAYGLLRSSKEAEGTVYGYTMWNTGGFPVALVDGSYKRRVEQKGSPIRVELLKIDRSQINHFDLIENEGVMYKRILETVYLDNGEVTSAWFYQGVDKFWSRRLLQPKIKDGDWRTFQKERMAKFRGDINMNIY